MKKIFSVLLLFSIVCIGSDWSGKNPEALRFSNDKIQYKYVAVFDTAATLTSGTKSLRKDYDVSWTTNPWTIYYEMTCADSITATTVTTIFFGVIEGESFSVDTLTIDFGTLADSSAYTTLDFNNRKFPEYRNTIASDSCTFTLVIY